MKHRKRTLWLILIIVLYNAWAVTTVSAHALLLRSNPQANAVLEKPPIQVELFFSEPLESNLSSIKVYDSNNLPVDVGDLRVDPSNPTRMTVSLRSLVDGIYTVTWKAVSSIDGHQTVGTFPFAVGNANATAVQAIQQSTNFRLPISTLIAKFLMLASLAILTGQRLFIALVWNPALRSDQDKITQPTVWKILYRIGLIGVLVSIGLGILSQAGQTTGNEISLPWDPGTGRVLTETRLGLIWLTRLALALLAVWMISGKESKTKIWTGFIANLSLLFTITLTSHAATEAKPLFPILGDWLHLVGMAFWLGGLVYLFTGIRQLQQLEEHLRTKSTSLLTTRFSINAIIFVSLIGITGFYSASLRVGTWSALLNTLYGHVLLIKQGFVAGLLIIAVVNLLIISPRLKRDHVQGLVTEKLVASFGKTLIAELIFAGLLLAGVSFLTYIPPARIATPTADLKSKTKADDLKLEISIAPGVVGQNTFTLSVITSEGHPLHAAKKVLLRFTPNQQSIPPSELELIGNGDGTYSAKGVNLSLAGNWQVQAVVRRADKFDAFANFDFKIQQPGSSDRTIASSRQSGGLLLTIGLLFALITLAMQTHSPFRLGLGIPLSVLMISLGVLYLTRPVVIENVQANPIPPTSESIAAGSASFTINCAPCHGVSGKGDGPIGLTLNPRPADLVQHAIPGVHTDAQLFEWITNGFPGTRMPAFKSTLSDTERWNLVNFIRTLAPK